MKVILNNKLKNPQVLIKLLITAILLFPCFRIILNGNVFFGDYLSIVGNPLEKTVFTFAVMLLCAIMIILLFIDMIYGDKTETIADIYNNSINFIKKSNLAIVYKNKDNNSYYTKNGKFPCTKTIKVLKAELEDKFIQINRGCLINKDHIQNVDKKQRKVIMTRKSLLEVDEVPKLIISKNYIKDVKNKLGFDVS